MLEPLTPVKQTDDTHFPLNKSPYQAALIYKLAGNSAAEARIWVVIVASPLAHVSLSHVQA